MLETTPVEITRRLYQGMDRLKEHLIDWQRSTVGEKP